MKQQVVLFIVIAVFVSGCAATIPKNLFQLSEESLNQRQNQMRVYETTDEEKMLSASSGVLQDLGFSIENSETKIGFIAGSKDADATNGAQVAGAIFMDMLSALGGTSSNYTGQCDGVQKVKASIIIKPSQESGKMAVRVTFQRIVWNKMKIVSRVETIKDDQIYQDFFTKLSKSVFLEEHKI